MVNTSKMDGIPLASALFTQAVFVTYRKVEQQIFYMSKNINKTGLIVCCGSFIPVAVDHVIFLSSSRTFQYEEHTIQNISK